MPIFKVFTIETKEVEMAYMVEATDEDDAADAIDQLKGLQDDAAARYMKQYGIESNLEAYADGAVELLLDGVEPS